MLISTRGLTVLATLLGALALGAPCASAADFPVSGASLLLRRARNGAELLSFVSNDRALPAPAVGGASDPSVAGALVEVVALDDPSVGAFVVPPGSAARPAGPGWRVLQPGGGAASYRYTNRAAPAAPSAVRALALRAGRRLQVTAERLGIDFAAPLGGVAIRVTVGADRICALFAGASVVRDEPGIFRGRSAPAAALADCSDEALGTAPPLEPGVFGDPWCDDGLPTPPESPPLVPPGPEAFHRVTHQDPLAVCNDGRPAVFFVRRATPGGGHENDWVIWLSGGGSCTAPHDCADRWCDRQQGPYSSRTMSGRWKAWDENHIGIFSTRADNRFKDFNQVFVPYCSSDVWTGTHTVDVPASTSPASGASYPGYRISFHGHHIVSALVAALRAGVTSDDGRETLAPLTAAQRVVFSGSSAGGAGAIHNANRVAALIRAGAPAIDVELVADGITRPYLPDPARNVTEAEVAQRRFVASQANALYGGLLDAACLADHPGDPTHLCTQPTHVLAHHVPLRTFVQMDLEDNTVGPWAYDSFADFGRATRELLEGFASATPQLAEPFAPVDLGVLGPRCGHHVTLENTTFYSIVVPQGGFDMNRTLWAWWGGAAVPELIDDGSATGSGCPPGS